MYTGIANGMRAYFRGTIKEFIDTDPTSLLGRLQAAYARDGFASQYTTQTRSWEDVVPRLRDVFRAVVSQQPTAADWFILLEYPLYRLRRRIDAVILLKEVVVVLEVKVGADEFVAHDARQVEDYALDLRDFHAGSASRRLVPMLWATRVTNTEALAEPPMRLPGVLSVVRVGTAQQLESLLLLLSDWEGSGMSQINGNDWDNAPYRPVPNVIEAATRIFSGHDVREIANADADNLAVAARRIVELVKEAKELQRRYLIFLTGVPGSGKTLAGLEVVHSAVATGTEREGDIVYLSGNSPLVIVLREALTQDRYRQAKAAGSEERLEDIRRVMRARIQHINDFIKDNVKTVSPSHEHAIVFDEAQRAWDKEQGMAKFERTASEPMLLLDIMGRHADWCACICLIGGGQEINAGEEGVRGWGDALRALSESEAAKWEVIGPRDVFDGGVSTGGHSLQPLRPHLTMCVEDSLRLTVPQRTFRSPSVSDWVDSVLAGNIERARELSNTIRSYPIVLTRSYDDAKDWLRFNARGSRRCGLLASSGARRLRAEGLGATLDAASGIDIAHWYLKPHGDIRSSNALEVAANQFTAQGLEIDFACVCWGGDFLWSSAQLAWRYSRLAGSEWQVVRSNSARTFIRNSYRVLLTRAREGFVIWIPQGDPLDHTRDPRGFDETAAFLLRCGARVLSFDEVIA
jgi:hypothetical protein